MADEIEALRKIVAVAVSSLSVLAREAHWHAEESGDTDEMGPEVYCGPGGSARVVARDAIRDAERVLR